MFKNFIVVLLFLFLMAWAGMLLPNTITLRPNGVGATTNLDVVPSGAPHWQTVDEISPDISDYVRRYNSGSALDTYALNDSGLSGVTINSITVYGYCTGDNNGTNLVRLAIRTGGSNYYSAYQNPAGNPGGTWAYNINGWTNNPNTGIAWTVADIDGLESGAELTSFGPTSLTEMAQCYVLVDFNPTALDCSASGTPTSGEAPLTVKFSSSGTGGTPPYSYSWQFGDGDTSTSQNPSHVYTSQGTYNWAFTLSDSGAQTCVKNGTINVSPAGSAPVADFTWTPTNPVEGQAVQFTDLSSNVPTSWSWQFGDGNSSTQQNPSHTFSSQGPYNVTLTASNAYGSSGKTRTITVSSTGSAPTADFSWSPQYPLVGQTVQFTDLSTAGPSSWYWQFGDGASSTQSNPTHSYSSSGVYSVSMTASNSYGTSSKTQSLTVTETPGKTYFIAAAANTVGGYDTNWKTDMVLHNPNSTTESATLSFLEAGKDNSEASGIAIAVIGRTSFKAYDIIGGLFGMTNAAGAMRIESSEAFVICSRTYNDQGEDGTYGQHIPGADSSEALAEGDEARLVLLTKNAKYRTNMGFVNATGQQIVVQASLYKGNGDFLGAKSYALKPYEFLQENNIIALFTAADVDDAYAVITSTTSNALYFAYASVVDNRTGDAIFIPAQK